MKNFFKSVLVVMVIIAGGVMSANAQNCIQDLGYPDIDSQFESGSTEVHFTKPTGKSTSYAKWVNGSITAQLTLKQYNADKVSLLANGYTQITNHDWATGNLTGAAPGVGCVGSDDAFVKNSNRKQQVHFVIMDNPFGEYRKYTSSSSGYTTVHVYSSPSGPNGFYAERNAVQYDSSYSAQPAWMDFNY